LGPDQTPIEEINPMLRNTPGLAELRTSALSALTLPVPDLGVEEVRLLKCLFFLRADTEIERIRRMPRGVTLVLDLEDSVAAEQKERQRSRIARLFRSGVFRRRHTLVRINGPDNPDEMRADLAHCLHPDLDGLLLAMVDSAGDIEEIDQLVGRSERARGLEHGHTSFVPLLERPGAVLQASAIAVASPRNVALSFGHIDFCLELNAEPCEEAVRVPRSMVLMAAKAHKLDAIAPTFLDLDDLDGFERENRRMKRLGFDGCFALTPRQQEKALEVYSYTREEIAHSRRVVKAIQEQGPIAKLDGKMIGPPMLKRALKILADIGKELREAA
jgi:citrate lyase subunit beta/citryl-CoA lyase